MIGAYRVKATRWQAADPSQGNPMDASRFTCTLAPAACSSYARVTIADAQGETARACPRHAVAALSGITAASVIWADTRGINDHERTALQLAEERTQLARTVAP